MKISKAIFWCLAAASAVTASAISDVARLEKRQLSTILSELESAIESAVDCDGCQVNASILSLLLLLSGLILSANSWKSWMEKSLWVASHILAICAPWI